MNARDEAYGDIVARELRGQVEGHEKRYLDEDLQRWLDALETLDERLGCQVREREARLEALKFAADPEYERERVEFLQWESKSEWFRSGVKGRIRDVRRLLSDGEEKSLAGRVRRLEGAVFGGMQDD